MYSSERQKLILDYIEQHDIVSTYKLQELTGASIATVRRDLNSMSQNGLIIKTHGGAKRITPDTPSGSSNTSFPVLDQMRDMNAKIGAELVQPGDIIFIGAGTTCTRFSRYIKDIEQLTVVTTNLNAIMELSTSDTVSMFLLGGDIHVGANYVETVGEYTLDALHKLYFDKFFFTVDGMDINYGYSIINKSQLPLYTYLLENSKQSYLFMDEEKINKRTFTRIGDLDLIHNIIFSSKFPKPYQEYFESSNIKVFQKQS